VKDFSKEQQHEKVIFVAGALALSGCSYILPQSSQTMHYQCGTTPLTVALDGKASEVSLLMDGEQLHLKQVLALTGAKYSDGKYTFGRKTATPILSATAR
jgi:Predicted periplasmic protein